MFLHPYLNFTGNAQEAIQFYADVFEAGQPTVMLFGDMPPSPEFPLPEEAKRLVANASIRVPGGVLMASDAPPWMPITVGTNASIMVQSADADQLKKLYGRLADGGKVSMPLQETFWSKCYGMLTDKFGIQWQFNHDPNA